MTHFMEALRGYFEDKNRSWITLDVDSLARRCSTSSDDSWWKPIKGGIQAKRREMHHRHSKILRAHSTVNIREVVNHHAGDRADAIVDELVTWVYRDGVDYGVTSRVIRHWQEWRRKNDRWVLVRDIESDERQKGPSVDEEENLTTNIAPLSWPTDRACTTYDRVRVRRYAELWWNGRNPAYRKFADDCTSFISQCLYAGNMPMTGGKNRASGWWYNSRKGWSYSWSMSNGLHNYLKSKVGAKSVKSAKDLKVGDVIFYDWGGRGNYHHSTVIVDFDSAGDPLVNAHTDNSHHRHYLYLDSRAWTQNTKYDFLHIPDQLC